MAGVVEHCEGGALIFGHLVPLSELSARPTVEFGGQTFICSLGETTLLVKNSQDALWFLTKYMESYILMHPIQVKEKYHLHFSASDGDDHLERFAGEISKSSYTSEIKEIAGYFS